MISQSISINLIKDEVWINSLYICRLVHRLIVLTSIQALALVAAFLLAMGDAGVNNVIYTTVPIVWGDKSLPAYGLFKVSLNNKNKIK